MRVIYIYLIIISFFFFLPLPLLFFFPLFLLKSPLLILNVKAAQFSVGHKCFERRASAKRMPTFAEGTPAVSSFFPFFSSLPFPLFLPVFLCGRERQMDSETSSRLTAAPNCCQLKARASFSFLHFPPSFSITALRPELSVSRVRAGTPDAKHIPFFFSPFFFPPRPDPCSLGSRRLPSDPAKKKNKQHAENLPPLLFPSPSPLPSSSLPSSVATSAHQSNQSLKFLNKLISFNCKEET